MEEISTKSTYKNIVKGRTIVIFFVIEFILLIVATSTSFLAPPCAIIVGLMTIYAFLFVIYKVIFVEFSLKRRLAVDWIKKHSFVILIIGFVIYAFWLSSNPNTNTPIKPPTCQPLRSGLKQPPMEALFMQETVKRGFEGIVSKKTNNNQTLFSVSTNMIPASSGPFYLWIIDADKNGQICKATNLGMLNKNDFGAWITTFKQSDYSDDSIKIAIAGNNFGSLTTDHLTTLSNPNILLIGSFDQSKWITEINLSPTPVISDTPTPTPCPTLDGRINQTLYGTCASPTPTPTPMPKGLVLTNQAMTSGVYPDYNPIFTAELHNYACFTWLDNNCPANYKNVVVRFSFYKKTGGSCLDPADDNEYITISDYIASGDTQTIKVPVKTSFDTSGAYTWCARIYGHQVAP